MAKLFLISGPSGSGKTTIMRRVMENEVVSFTTREPRPGEKNGVDYLFITRDEFYDMYRSGGLVESSEYGGNHYGITKAELDSKLAKGPAFAIVDAAGALSLRTIVWRCVGIFIYATPDECDSHLSARGESQAFIEKRLSTYDKEVLNRSAYEYVIRNVDGHFGDTVEIVRRIVNAEVSA